MKIPLIIRPTASAKSGKSEGFSLNAPTSRTSCPRERNKSPMATFNWNPAWSEPITSFITGSLSENFFCSRHDLVRFDTEFFQQVFQRRGSAETAHANHLALEADVALPSKRGSHFHGNPRAYTRGEDIFLVCGVLAFEQFP